MAFAYALAFDCPVVDAFVLALAFVFDSYAFYWNQIRNKCESNETVSLLFNKVYFVSWFRLESASGNQNKTL